MFDLPKPYLVGMIHLPALPGSPSHRMSMAGTIIAAQRDAECLQKAGFDALIIENFGDAPFTARHLDPATVAAMGIIVSRVKDATALILGVNALRNDARSALAIAFTVGAQFIRVNVHTGVSATDQGWIEGDAAATLAYRRSLGANIAIFADVHVKHAVHVSQPDIALAAEETAYRGQADALIVSGPTTGRPTDPAQLHRVKSAVPDKPVLIGSGATVENIATLLAACDGVIVGTHIKKDGRTDASVDYDRAAAFVQAARG